MNLRATIALIGLVPTLLHGQAPEVSARLDTSTIRIGEQAHLDLQVTYRVDQGHSPRITWPAIADSVGTKVDLVADGGIDTVLLHPDQDPYLFAQRRMLTITSWDSGYWAIPPFRFVLDGDTAETGPLLLTVHTVEVDTTKAFRDIKEIYEVPFSWRFWLKRNWPYIAGGVAALAAILLLVREVRRRRRRGPVPKDVPEPTLPLAVRTMDALDVLEKKKLWQQGQIKAYHVELTTILREYIEERCSVPALESTTDELMQRLALGALSSAHREMLVSVLRMADLAKFAKLHPTPTENEAAMATARRFVQETTPIQAPLSDAQGS